jgi:hypothetical protein
MKSFLVEKSKATPKRRVDLGNDASPWNIKAKPHTGFEKFNGSLGAYLYPTEQQKVVSMLMDDDGIRITMCLEGFNEVMREVTNWSSNQKKNSFNNQKLRGF